MPRSPRSGSRRSRALAALTATALTVGLTLAATASSQAADDGWLHTDGSRIVTSTGSEFTIKATSWFGLETQNCALHGLWQIPLDQGLGRIAGWGFNTIRIPFSSECLAATGSNSINEQANPGLAALSPLELLDRIVARADAHGLKVILDRHRPDSGGQSELWYTAQYSEQRWIEDWEMLAERYREDPTVIGVDLHNEPHGSACWGCGDPARDWSAAATRAGNAVLAVNPHLLIIVEGVEREADGSTTWWGGGLRGVADHPVVLDVPNRVVYSPHDYPATVWNQSWFGAADYPANLPGVWERNWGYIQTQGIAPVWLGEFGTKLETDSDRQWLASLVDYLGEKRIGFSYWSFNPNSGDTGGLVKDDWTTPQTEKLRALAPLGITTDAVTPTATSSPSPTATPTSTPSPAPTPTRTPSPSPTPTPTPTVGPTPSPSASPTPVPTPPPTAPPTAGNPAGVAATWILQSAWSEGYVAELVLTAEQTATGWTISWPAPQATSVANAWGMACALESGTITCVGNGQGWTVPLAAGQQARVGVQVAATAAPTSPEPTIGSTR